MDIRVWEVVIDQAEPQWFDSLDVAVAYARAELSKGGGKSGHFESRFVSKDQYEGLT